MKLTCLRTKFPADGTTADIVDSQFVSNPAEKRQIQKLVKSLYRLFLRLQPLLRLVIANFFAARRKGHTKWVIGKQNAND